MKKLVHVERIKGKGVMFHLNVRYDNKESQGQHSTLCTYVNFKPSDHSCLPIEERLKMAVEAVVSFVVEKLGNFLVEQAVFLHEAHGQLGWVERELRRMQCFLKDADAKQGIDERVKNWVAEVRDVAYDAEDIVDTFMFRIEEQKRKGFVGFIERCTLTPFNISAQCKIGSDIERIKNKLDEISNSRSTYDIKVDGEGSSSRGEYLRERSGTSPLLEDTEVVGFEEDVKKLVAQLIDDEPLRCAVVSIVGMGGLGKTTLARKVYNNDVVKNHFSCYAWIHVSQEYSTRDLLQNILFVLTEQKELEMNIVQLRERIFLYLDSMKYLIVVDDIWKTEAWDALVPAFPDAKNGSRVLLTTRNKDVALYADAQSLPHELEFLGGDESWELFRKKTFLEEGNQCPQHLETFGREIVAKCHGLPLAIVVAGGLLSRKERRPAEWEKVLKSLSWQFVERETQISRVLSLSYEDLPYQLKPCFLYLGVFPEDCEFCSKKLIKLWVAEGFIQQRGAETLEEVAEDILDELIFRNLIQVARRSCTGVIRRCRIHDLIRDLSISKARENKFLIVYDANTNSLSPSNVRRLAVRHGIQRYPCFKRSTPHLRSISCFTSAKERLGKNNEKLVYTSFKLLRVLDLFGFPVKMLPNEIGALIHLRYLGCRRSKLKSLPRSIGSLCNLQTLDITSNHLLNTPDVIWKMQQLRHLRMKGSITKRSWWSKIKNHSPPKLECSSNFQTLTHVKAGEWIDDCLKELTNLKRLGIWGKDWQSRHGKGFSDALSKMNQLQYLKLGEWALCSIPTLPPLSHHQHLYKLFLHGRLEKLPESHDFPPNLTKLTLQYSRLEHNPMTTLEKLSNLKILRLLASSYIGKEMACSAQGFALLESLHLGDLNELEEWRMEEGTMPSLLHLRIDYCIRLKTLPEGLQHVTTLKKFELKGKFPPLEDRVREGGADWHKIRDIPSVDIC